MDKKIEILEKQLASALDYAAELREHYLATQGSSDKIDGMFLVCSMISRPDVLSYFDRDQPGDGKMMG